MIDLNNTSTTEENVGASNEVPTNSTVEEATTPTVTEEETPINCSSFDIKSLKDNYLFGIDLVDANGNPFPQSLLATFLNGAISWAEQLFDICLSEVEVIDEAHDYERSDYMNWGYIQAFKRPIKEVKSLRLTYGNETAFEVPLDWLKVDKIAGKLSMFPSQGSVNNLIINQSGVIFGLQQRWSHVPQMWSMSYIAGLQSQMPENLKVLVYKKATCDIMTIWGDLILGPGIASHSLSIDGLSQSIGTSRSASSSVASARISQYQNDIKEMIPVLKMKYDTMRMVVL